MKRGRPKLSAEDNAERLSLYNAGLTDEKMRKVLNLSRAAVSAWRRNQHPKLEANR